VPWISLFTFFQIDLCLIEVAAMAPERAAFFHGEFASTNF
jgi:hypothetical protein